MKKRGETVQQGGSCIVDPVGNFYEHWNKGALILCVIALAVDPLFLYIPEANLTKKCVELDGEVAWAACILRTVVDVLYVFHMALKFRTAFIPTSSSSSKHNNNVNIVCESNDDDLDLVKASSAIARRYLSSYFFIDILSILPLPQFMMVRVMISNLGPTAYVTKQSLKVIIIFSQSIPRIIRIYPIYKQFKSTSGFLAQTAWAGAAFNLFLYILASHATGAFWYLISVERQNRCWHETCDNTPGCNSAYIYCDERHNTLLVSTANLDFFIASMNNSCPLTNPDDITDPTTTFDFGIFIDALRSRIVQSKSFPKKFFYCSWWGLRNLSSVGQNLKTSTFIGEAVFAIGISIIGLVLFALLIGNMQTYLQSLSGRIEKMRVRRGDAEEWMSRRRLPHALKKKVRKYEQCKWQITKGVDEEDVINNLPKDLRRDIHRHIWNNTFVKPLTKVHIFKEMDQGLMNEMFDLLKPVVFPKKTTIIEEGGTVDEILFITKGCMKSDNERGGGFFFTSKLKVGDLFGEELLTWACSTSSSNPNNNTLPISTRKVVTKSHIEAYALTANNFKSLASKFQSSLDTNQVEHLVKYQSMPLRRQGASTIQKAWHHHRDIQLQKALRQAIITIPLRH